MKENNKLECCANEKQLLNYLMSQLRNIDADIVIGKTVKSNSNEIFLKNNGDIQGHLFVTITLKNRFPNPDGFKKHQSVRSKKQFGN